MNYRYQRFTKPVMVAILVVIAWYPAFAETAVFQLKSALPVSQDFSYRGDKISGHQTVINNLMEQASVSQSDFLAALDELKSRGQISSYTTLWITNAVVVTGTRETIANLANRADVEMFFDDAPVELITPIDSSTSPIAAGVVENSLRVIGAVETWALGLDGHGSLVCNFDTGVNGNHSALLAKYRGNNGGSPSACWFDPYSNTNYPNDHHGHGTHTMGTMVGSSETDTVGVAPGAEWIAAAVVNRGGGIERTISDILAAFQWAADPDGDPSTTDDVPDVVNNSWGIPLGYYPACDETFWHAIDNLEAAGVVCIFAAGNEGPHTGTIRTPADRISSEFNAFSVGAIDGSNPDFAVAEFSSRGPSGCDNQTIKPEVTAPGVSIRSTGRDGGYVTFSGTSMAAPHAAGAVAILRQFNPHATPQEIKAALMNSAMDRGQPGEDNDYGWGIIDIHRALEYMPIPERPFPVLVSTIISGDSLVLPGEEIDLGVAFGNLGQSETHLLAHLISSDSRVTIRSGDISFGPLAHDDTAIASSWNISFDNNIDPGERIEFNIELSSQGWVANMRFAIVIGDQATSIHEQPTQPRAPLMMSNYPNPFNSSTVIKIDGPMGENSAVMIFDTLGRLVRELAVENNNSGNWDGADNSGQPVSGGIYFARLSNNSGGSIKMLLIK